MDKSTNNTLTSLEGKKQIIELLKAMPHHDKTLLLKNIKQKNPLLASELWEAGISFEQLQVLDDEQLTLLTRNITPAILGLALKKAPPELQRRFLRATTRPYAEVAFQVMNVPLQDGLTKVDRAQEKVLNIAVGLFSNSFVRSL